MMAEGGVQLGRVERQYQGEGESESEGELDPRAEAEAAGEIARMSNESELEQFLPLLIGPLLTGLKALAPIVMRAAVPLLRNVGSQALASVAGPPQQQEYGGWRGRRHGYGEGEVQGEWWHHRRHWFGRPWGWNRWMPQPPQPPPPDGDGEHFLGLGKLVGGLFSETEQEQEQENFLLGKLLGGLMGEVDGLDADAARHTTARWFVRLARRAARHAASGVMARHRSGEQVSWPEVKRIVFDAVLGATHGHAPPGHHGHRHHGQDGAHGHPGHAQSGWGGGTHGQHAAGPHHGATPQSGRWVRQGGRIVIEL